MKSKKLNIFQKIIIRTIKVYQKYLSPDHSFWAKHRNHPYCRYFPTCSQYFIEAVEKKGAICGSLKGIWRIMRCMPWSKGGYDPVEKEKGK
ncbi:membrane protein insertion efficiency factor YidD [Candidatus Gracilibacteria bacterium GN02-872]|nr:membrane protein insertion efficiency factor YidD [Candidatus Gracilibacteria bacterium GN02-872]